MTGYRPCPDSGALPHAPTIEAALEASRAALGHDVVILMDEAEDGLVIDGAPVYVPGYVPPGQMFIVTREEWERNISLLASAVIRELEKGLA